MMPIKTWNETKADFKMLWEERDRGILWMLKKFGNIIDDPIDWVKEKNPRGTPTLWI